MSSTGAVKFRVAIIGAGIAGTGMAALLSKCDGIPVDLYEKSKETSTKGAGLAVWRRYYDMLNEVIPEFDTMCVAAGGNSFTGWDRALKSKARRSDFKEGGVEICELKDHKFKSYQRGPLLETLLANIDSGKCTIHKDKKLTNYKIMDNGIQLVFNNGETATTDVLIGADGVHSRVRSIMYAGEPSLAKSQLNGDVAYQFPVSAMQLEREWEGHPALQGLKFWCGQGSLVVTSAIGPTIFVTVYAREQSDLEESEGSHKELEENFNAKDKFAHFKDWEPALAHLFKGVEFVRKWPIYVVNPDMSNYYCTKYMTAASGADKVGPVAIIGDAAHAMLPYQGVGGGQGLEDAYVLWKLLSHPQVTRKNVMTALKSYNSVRSPAAKIAAENSRVLGEMAKFDYGPHIAELTPLSQVGSDMCSRCDWLKQGSCERAGNEAVNLLLGEADIEEPHIPLRPK